MMDGFKAENPEASVEEKKRFADTKLPNYKFEKVNRYLLRNKIDMETGIGEKDKNPKPTLRTNFPNTSDKWKDIFKI